MSRPTRYEIELCGRLDARVLRPVIDEFDVETTENGTTRLTGDVLDASHLHGLLAHFTSLNVQVVELRRLPDPHNPSTINPSPINPPSNNPSEGTTS